MLHLCCTTTTLLLLLLAVNTDSAAGLILPLNSSLVEAAWHSYLYGRRIVRPNCFTETVKDIGRRRYFHSGLSSREQQWLLVKLTRSLTVSWVTMSTKMQSCKRRVLLAANVDIATAVRGGDRCVASFVGDLSSFTECDLAYSSYVCEYNCSQSVAQRLEARYFLLLAEPNIPEQRETYTNGIWLDVLAKSTTAEVAVTKSLVSASWQPSYYSQRNLTCFSESNTRFGSWLYVSTYHDSRSHWLLFELKRPFNVTYVKMEYMETFAEYLQSMAEIFVYTAQRLNIDEVVRGNDSCAARFVGNLSSFVLCGVTPSMIVRYGAKYTVNCCNAAGICSDMTRYLLLRTQRVAPGWLCLSTLWLGVQLPENEPSKAAAAARVSSTAPTVAIVAAVFTVLAVISLLALLLLLLLRSGQCSSWYRGFRTALHDRWGVRYRDLS